MFGDVVEIASTRDAILSFSITNDESNTLRSAIRRLAEQAGLADAGTSLFAGQLSESRLRQLIEDIKVRVARHRTGAKLVNLEVWLAGTQRFRLILEEDEVA